MKSGLNFFSSHAKFFNEGTTYTWYVIIQYHTCYMPYHTHKLQCTVSTSTEHFMTIILGGGGGGGPPRPAKQNMPPHSYSPALVLSVGMIPLLQAKSSGKLVDLYNRHE